jgi:hypothetical protein
VDADAHFLHISLPRRMTPFTLANMYCNHGWIVTNPTAQGVCVEAEEAGG